MNSPFLVPWKITSPSCCWWNPPWNANKSIPILILVKKIPNIRHETRTSPLSPWYYCLLIKHDIYIYTHEKRQKITTPYQTSCQTFPIYHIILSSSKKKPNISYIHIIYIYTYIHIFPGYSQTSFHHRPKMQFWSLISYKCLFFTGLYIL